MASASGGQEQGGEKNTYYILWLVALIVFFGSIIWYFFDTPLKQAFLFIRMYELKALYFCLTFIPLQLPWFGESIHAAAKEIGLALTLAEQTTPDTINLNIAEALSMTVGNYWRYPVSIYLAVLSFIVLKTNIQMRLRKKYNMRSLAEQEKVLWPQISIATKIDLLQEDLDSGPWAMAMTPMQFSKKNKLVSIDLAEPSATPFSKLQPPEYKVTLNRARAERAFCAQLGRTWQGVEAMEPHRRALFAVFAARGARDTNTALKLVNQLAKSAAEGVLDFTGVDDLWQKHLKNKQVEEICQQHAYEFTVFISLLMFAREDGVVASADFLWVKPIDRRLWYVINNVGRQTPCVEVGGIFCHWYYEMALKRALSAPRVANAVDALELALSEIIYIPDQQEKQEILNRHTGRQVPDSTVNMEQANP